MFIPNEIDLDSVSVMYETGAAGPTLNLQLFFPFYNVYLLSVSLQYRGNVNGWVNPTYASFMNVYRFGNTIRSARGTSYNSAIGSGPAIAMPLFANSTQYYPCVECDGVFFGHTEPLNTGDASATFAAYLVYGRKKNKSYVKHKRKWFL